MTSTSPDPGLVARLRAAGCVFAEDEAALLEAEPVSAQEREEMVVRREAGEPLELILGWAEFDGMRIKVAPGVFVPRQRSRLLLELASCAAESALQRTPGSTPRIVDIGCGTGALAAALALRVGPAEVWATDIDPAAVECAQANLSSNVLLGDLFSPLPQGLAFDVVVANAPYVPTERIADMPPEARDHEHRVALDGGVDGLDIQRRVIEQAPKHLAPGGVLVIEASQEQAPVTADLMRAQGLIAEIHHDDDLYATAVTGTAR
ncbi:putative protein N(5)-glutamine methyltransferase [Nocardioides albus]|uniref:Release factor glutamine methyltransferase n=1 Tax=Nocardioides albus TaxID=1841 RepID=A0A7W5A6N1_9ACTN|nr:putative protein N(5)-glutamine methyltransferase [Nocardioides albus]MBB3090409.1 release factor glutamine methyltransferase [Nocardioides albus]GGU23692.1 N5-glutamine S-adenosyl-L-methionine-dependent methyltransferase [Nocardioides albus]